MKPAFLALLLAFPAVGWSEGDVLPPIVFVSRAYVATLNDYDAGPPAEVTGRELTAGGTLNLLQPDGKVVVLAGPQNVIFDVQRPMVSFDGTRVVFSGVRERNGMWRIYEIGLDGTHLRQLTPVARGVDIPDDPRLPKRNASTFGRFGDFSPAYLPDGRIVFSSSRYPSLSGSSGQRGLALYVMNGDGSGLRRIVSARSGALTPSVMADGRILYAMWADNMNLPSLANEGIQPLEDVTNFGSSAFVPWVVNPDGSGAGRIGFLAGRLSDGYGGGIHYREMPNGEIVYTRRAAANFLGSTLASSIAKFRPGDGEGSVAEGIGDPLVLEAPHALAPEPLPDGRIVFAYTPKARVWVDENHRTLAEFDYGLYLCDGDFKNLKLLYDNPGTEELDPVAVYPRQARVIPDQIVSLPPEFPSSPVQDVAILESRGVYADLDRRFTSAVSPPVGSVSSIEIYDDAQTFTTSDEFPLIHKQMPRFYKSFPVAADGSFRAEIPADRPVFYFLRGPTGSAVRYPDGLGAMRTAMFGHAQVRPGEERSCSGCHRGHMIRPDLSERAGINLARLARVVGSSTKDPSFMGPARVVDGDIGLANGRYQWAPLTSDASPWVLISWEQAVTPRQVVVYPRPNVGDGLGSFEVYLSDGRLFMATPDPVHPNDPITVTIPEPGPVTWMHVRITGYPHGGAPGIAEIEVRGDPLLPEAPDAPAPPPAFSVSSGILRLSWLRSPSRSVIGYRIGAGDLEWDVGNTTSYQPESLSAGGKYSFFIRAYDAIRFGPPTWEVSATLVPPRADRITPSSGPAWGGTDVTIEGAGFVSGTVVKVGTELLRNLRLVGPDTLVGTTYRQPAGLYDVVVRNPGKIESLLPKAFRYE